MRALTIVALMLGVVACQGEDAAAKRAQERLKKVQAEKAEKKKKSAELDAKRQAALKGGPRLGPPWDDAKILLPDGPCPVGVWTLFAGPAPGADPAERKENEASRGELATAVTAETYVVRLRSSDGIAVQPFDAQKSELGLAVKGSMECKDAAGRVVIAWTAATPGSPRGWVAAPVVLPVSMATAAEAKAWGEKAGPELAARVAFRLGRGEAPTQPDTTKAGGVRLLHAELMGVRIATDQDRNLVAEKKIAQPPRPAPAPEE